MVRHDKVKRHSKGNEAKLIDLPGLFRKRFFPPLPVVTVCFAGAGNATVRVSLTLLLFSVSPPYFLNIWFETGEFVLSDSKIY